MESKLNNNSAYAICRQIVEAIRPATTHVHLFVTKPFGDRCQNLKMTKWLWTCFSNNSHTIPVFDKVDVKM